MKSSNNDPIQLINDLSTQDQIFINCQHEKEWNMLLYWCQSDVEFINTVMTKYRSAKEKPPSVIINYLEKDNITYCITNISILQAIITELREMKRDGSIKGINFGPNIYSLEAFQRQLQAIKDTLTNKIRPAAKKEQDITQDITLDKSHGTDNIISHAINDLKKATAEFEGLKTQSSKFHNEYVIIHQVCLKDLDLLNALLMQCNASVSEGRVNEWQKNGNTNELDLFMANIKSILRQMGHIEQIIKKFREMNLSTMEHKNDAYPPQYKELVGITLEEYEQFLLTNRNVPAFDQFSPDFIKNMNNSYQAVSNLLEALESSEKGYEIIAKAFRTGESKMSTLAELKNKCKDHKQEMIKKRRAADKNNWNYTLYNQLLIYNNDLAKFIEETSRLVKIVEGINDLQDAGVEYTSVNDHIYLPTGINNLVDYEKHIDNYIKQFEVEINSGKENKKKMQEEKRKEAIKLRAKEESLRKAEQEKIINDKIEKTTTLLMEALEILQKEIAAGYSKNGPFPLGVTIPLRYTLASIYQLDKYIDGILPSEDGKYAFMSTIKRYSNEMQQGIYTDLAKYGKLKLHEELAKHVKKHIFPGDLNATKIAYSNAEAVDNTLAQHITNYKTSLHDFRQQYSKMKEGKVEACKRFFESVTEISTTFNSLPKNKKRGSIQLIMFPQSENDKLTHVSTEPETVYDCIIAIGSNQSLLNDLENNYAKPFMMELDRLIKSELSSIDEMMKLVNKVNEKGQKQVDKIDHLQKLQQSKWDLQKNLIDLQQNLKDMRQSYDFSFYNKILNSCKYHLNALKTNYDNSNKFIKSPQTEVEKLSQVDTQEQKVMNNLKVQLDKAKALGNDISEKASSTLKKPLHRSKHNIKIGQTHQSLAEKLQQNEGVELSNLKPQYEENIETSSEFSVSQDTIETKLVQPVGAENLSEVEFANVQPECVAKIEAKIKTTFNEVKELSLQISSKVAEVSREFNNQVDQKWINEIEEKQMEIKNYYLEKKQTIKNSLDEKQKIANLSNQNTIELENQNKMDSANELLSVLITCKNSYTLLVQTCDAQITKLRNAQEAINTVPVVKLRSGTLDTVLNFPKKTNESKFKKFNKQARDHLGTITASRPPSVIVKFQSKNREEEEMKLLISSSENSNTEEEPSETISLFTEETVSSPTLLVLDVEKKAREGSDASIPDPKKGTETSRHSIKFPGINTLKTPFGGFFKPKLPERPASTIQQQVEPTKDKDKKIKTEPAQQKQYEFTTLRHTKDDALTQIYIKLDGLKTTFKNEVDALSDLLTQGNFASREINKVQISLASKLRTIDDSKKKISKAQSDMRHAKFVVHGYAETQDITQHPAIVAVNEVIEQQTNMIKSLEDTQLLFESIDAAKLAHENQKLTGPVGVGIGYSRNK